MPDTLYKSFNLLNILQKVRDFTCVVYIDNKTADKGRLICLIIRELQFCEKFEIVRIRFFLLVKKYLEPGS